MLSSKMQLQVVSLEIKYKAADVWPPMYSLFYVAGSGWIFVLTPQIDAEGSVEMFYAENCAMLHATKPRIYNPE